MTTETFLHRHRDKAVPVGAAVAVAIAAITFRAELIAWFGGDVLGSGDVSAAVEATGGALTIDAALQPDPPQQEGNSLILTIKGADGAPVDDATVSVMITMPAMGSMPEMRTKADVKPEGDGRFRASFDVAMAGTWTANVEVESSLGQLSSRYTFTLGSRGLTHVSTTGSGAPAAGVTYEFAPPALDALLRAMAAYERVRVGLAGDDIARLSSDARTLAEALGAARTAATAAPPELATRLEQAASLAADKLATAPTVATARDAFSAVSEQVVPLVAADPRLAKENHVFECTMRKGFNKWVQPSDKIANPYQGTKMSTCGSEIDWQVVSTGKAPVHDPDDIAYYTCPMHSWVREKDPGHCPVCGMDLLSVSKETVRSGVLQIDHDRRQLIGMKFGKVGKRPVTLHIRAIGKIVYDETRLNDVTLKYRGWIETLAVDRPGQFVRRNQELFTLYSPELYAAQQEYLLALRQQKTARDDAGRRRAEALERGARERLRLWDVTERQIAKLAATGKPRQYIPILSPASGYVVEKNVVEGAAVKAGERLFRVAGLDKVWVEAEVYEQDIPYVKVGQQAVVTMSHVPGKEFKGKVSFVYPYMDRMTRTTRVRIVLDNRKLELKPDMFANVDIQVDLGERLMVPEAAILYSGPRRIVFLDLPGDPRRPPVVEVGVLSDSYYEVLSGLKEGDDVVTSGNFLLSSESRLKSATGLW